MAVVARPILNSHTGIISNGLKQGVSADDLTEMAQETMNPGTISSLKRRVELHKAISVTEHVPETVLRQAKHQCSQFLSRLCQKGCSLKTISKKYKDSWDVLTLPAAVFRVVVLGSGGVGKTSLVKRFISGTFSEQYTPTVGDLYEKSVTLSKDFNAFLEIMDTAGSYPFPAMKKLTIQNADAFVLVYSVDEKASLQEALELQREIVYIKGKTVPMVLVGNKTDLVSEELRQSTRAQMRKVSRERGVLCSEASAKLGLNIGGVFTALLAQIAVNSETKRIHHKTKFFF